MNTDSYKSIENENIVEQITLFIYTLYTIAMTVVSMVLQWGHWVEVIILSGLVLAWFITLRHYKTYRFRAITVSALALMNFVIYGFEAETLFGILSTMSALVILLAIYNIKEIIYIATAASLMLLFSHAFILRTIRIPDSKTELTRMLLQICSMFTVECVTYYLVKTQIAARDRLRETIADLKQAEKSKDDFMSNVSHEIRTPINIIYGISEMALMDSLSPSVREDVLDIQMASRNLLGIVSDILDFSELQSGNIALVEEPYNITSTINDVMNMSLAKMENKPIELIVDCDAKIPCSLLGDEQKIRRVLTNIISNAAKFTKEGCICLQVSCRSEEYGINLIVSVQDTGIGIKKENLERIFSCFNQVDTEKNRKEGGIGLGLAISKAIVRKMGGFLSVQSTYGKGTEVKFTIPQKVLDTSPIIEVNQPKDIHVLSYINYEKYSFNAVRIGYAQNISHMVEKLGVFYHACRNLNELKRRINKDEYTHIFIGWEEYMEDKTFFDEQAQTEPVVLILSRENDCKAGKNLLKIYKPFYALSVAAVLNGEHIVQSSDGTHALHQKFRAPEARVLVVDDNLMNLKVIEGLLRPYEIKVFTAESGKEALNKLKTMTFDFIFMDHMMPEMDGVETYHRIRQMGSQFCRTVPVIALTANAIGGAREMFLAEGFQDFIAKPIVPSVLERVLRKYIPDSKIEHAFICEEDITSTKTVKQEIQKEEKQDSGFEGIDLELGISYCGGTMEDYLGIAQVYYATGVKKIEQIQQYYDKKDWKNYEILVHALKSTSLGIGAVQLSEQAKKLETAAQEQHEEYILNHHNSMIQAYQRLLEVLKADQRICLNEDEKAKVQEDIISEQTSVLKIISLEQLKNMLQQLSEKLETFESDEVARLLEEFDEYSYENESLHKWLQSVKEQVENFDYIAAEEALDKVREKVGCK